MSLYQGPNRVFVIRDIGGAFHYIAVTAAAALAHHRSTVKGPSRKLNAIELSAEKQVIVSFADCAEAIAAITGADSAELIRPSIKHVPFVDESIRIGRPADHWAHVSRSAPVPRLLARLG